MGRWDRRWIPRRRYNSKKYRDYDYEEPPPSPPSPHHRQSNPPPIQENSGSSWEIDFCKSVRVPWKKILAAKNFMHCYENVFKWDDSAAEETFHDAKRRYWEKINCLPCKTPLPDEDIYIDEINWNPNIDPKLISDLDQEHFNPDKARTGDILQTSVERRNNAVPVCGPVQNNENPDELPWEIDAAQGVGVRNDTVLHWGQNTESINSKDVTNPWEQSYTLGDKSLKNNAWKGSADKGPNREVGNCWVQTAESLDSKDVNNLWEQSHLQFDESLRNKAWKVSAGEDPAKGVRTQWGQNAKSVNSKDVNNPWEQRLSQFDESLTTNGWKVYAGVDPQEVRTNWGLNAKSINLKEVRNPWEQSRIQYDDSLENNAWKVSACKSPAQRVGTHYGQYADSINPKDVNPWEQSCTPVDDSLKNNAWKSSAGEISAQRIGTPCGQFTDSINPKDVNPWEQSSSPVDESLWNNACKGCPEESWRWRKESTYNRWSAENAGDKRWNHVDDSSRCWKQGNISSHEQQYPVNTGNTWQRSFPSHTGVSRGCREWTAHGNNSRGGKQPEIQNKRSKNVNYKGISRGQKVEQSGCRKREGSLQHSARYKTSRCNGDDYMTAQKWPVGKISNSFDSEI